MRHAITASWAMPFTNPGQNLSSNVRLVIGMSIVTGGVLVVLSDWVQGIASLG